MTISSNAYLSLDDMKINAQYILDKLMSLGWTAQAVCAMLGNMQTESTINPGIWENLQANNMNGGFGLVQWTPATKFTNWADANGYNWGDIDGQISRIVYEKDNGLQWQTTSAYPMTFPEFIISTDTPSNLALTFMTNYENPLNPSQTSSDRSSQADYWYNNLTFNSSPVTRPKQKKMPLYYYLRQF